MSNPVILQNISDQPARQEGIAAAKKKEPQSQESALLLAYMMIFEAVNINRQSASVKAKELQSNAVAQNELIAEESGFQFTQIPQSKINKAEAKKTKVGATVLQEYEEKNQIISSMRNTFEDKLTVIRQNASIQETDLNSSVQTTTQNISQGSNLMQMLVALTNQVSRI